jgi:hypothetical protein
MGALPDEKTKEIKDEVMCETRRQFERAGFKVPKIAKELAIIAFSDPDDFVEVAEGGELRFRTFKEMGKKRRAIKSISEKTVITESKDGERLYKTSTVDYELWSKSDALKTAIEVIGIKKPQQVNHSHTIDGKLDAIAAKVFKANRRG